MSTRLNILFALVAALVGGVLVFSPPLRAADPEPLACPNGQTVVLTGQAPARESLLVFLDGRPVGGGLSRSDGRFSLPLRPQERPGIYPIEVRLRSSRALVASYTCFIDVPLEAAPTPTPAPGSPAPVTPARSATIAPTATVTRATGAPTPTPSATGTAGTAQPTTTTAPTAATTTTAATATTTTTTTTVTGVEIEEIVLRDPAFPDTSDEYVWITNNGDSPVNIGGWRLLNASRAGQVPPYVFPSFTLGVDVTITVLSAVGDNDLNSGEFYWDQPPDIWRVNDVAELRDAQNRLVATLVVPAQ